MKKDLRKVESAVLLALLLIPGLLIALPAVSFVSAYSGASPATLTGVTAAMDYPIFASIASATNDTRVIIVTNPTTSGTGITSITVSVPTTASTVKPHGTIPTWGGVTACSVSACDIAGSGVGPWALVYQHSGTDVILPAGAKIYLTISLTPETSTTSSTTADTPQLNVYVTDTTGASTQLSNVQLYYTTASSVTMTGPSSTSQTAGSTFTFTASLAQTLVPLYVSDNTGDATLSPTSWISGSSAQTITVNDTTAETDYFKVGGPAPNSHSSNGILTNGTDSSTPVVVSAAAVSKLTVKVAGYAASKVAYINETSATLVPASGASGVTVYTTDKYGNAAPFSLTATTYVTLSATTLSGQAAGFTNETSYTTPTNYPYTPTDLKAAVAVQILPGASSAPSNSKYYFGPDYGSLSQIVATSSSLPSGTSSTIRTWALNSALPTVGPPSTSIKSGSTATVNATLPTIAQAGVTVYFSFSTNSTDYAGTFSNGLRTITATTVVNSAHQGVATVSLSVDPTVGATAVLAAKYVETPTTNSSAGISGTVSTIAGPFAKLAVKAYFDSAEADKATASVASGTLYIDAILEDVGGNPVTVSAGTVQVTLATTAGTLSASTAYVTATHSSIDGSSYQVQLIAPASGSFTVSAVAAYNGVSGSGSTTLSIVSKLPTVTFTSVPTSVTSGIPQVIKGWANVSTGVAPTTISTLEYSLNGATNVTIGAGSATNQFTLTLLLATTNTLTVYAKDGNGVWNSATTQIPTVAVAQTFTNSTAPKSIQFPNGGPQAVNATFTNNGYTSLTVIVVGEVFQNVSNKWIPLSPPVSSTITNLGAGAKASAYLLLQGYAAGNYEVQITVYSLAYVTLSPTYTVYVTVA